MNKEKLLAFIDEKIKFWEKASYDDYFIGYIHGLQSIKKFLEEEEKEG